MTTTAGAFQGLKGGVQKARAVNQSAHRAVRIRQESTNELKEATSSYAHSLTSGFGFFIGAGVIGAASFVVLTVGLVIGLNALVGAPAGYFLTVLAYLVVAGVLIGVGKRSRETKREDAKEHAEHVRSELRYASHPMVKAFGSNGK